MLIWLKLLWNVYLQSVNFQLVNLPSGLIIA